MAEGRKDDSGKLRFDLIPVEPLMLLAEVYTIGSRKYSDRNWEKGLQFGRVFAALMRHAWKWWRGEQRDEVDGQHHLASVAWCAFALMEYERTHKELDDRPHTNGPRNSGTAVYVEIGSSQPSSYSKVPDGTQPMVCSPGTSEKGTQ